MTYLRTPPTPLDGLADDPDALMRIFMQIRAAMMGVDQNNVREAGVRRGDIVQGTTVGTDAHYGITDALAIGGSGDPVAYDQTSTTQTLTLAAYDNVWFRDPNISISITAREDAFWLVGCSGQWTLTTSSAVHTDWAQLTMRPVIAGGTTATLAEAIVVGDTETAKMPTTADGCFGVVFVPAGKHTATVELRVNWRGALADDVIWDQANLFAVGLYR